MGHARMENRSGLVMDARVTTATGTAEQDAAIDMIEKIPGLHRVTIGADKNYDTADFVGVLRSCNATPHVAQNDTNRTSAIDSRTTGHAGYTLSQKVRKTIGTLRKTRYRGVKKVAWYFTRTAAAYNLVRMRNLGLGIT